MSVVFDVLDSLNSIRNVEDLKKRWEVDSKRPQTLSYEAVDMFMCLFSGYVDADEFVIRLSNFTLRYQEVVSENICSAGDLAWLMPYIRYAEKLKANSFPLPLPMSAGLPATNNFPVLHSHNYHNDDKSATLHNPGQYAPRWHLLQTL